MNRIVPAFAMFFIAACSASSHQDDAAATGEDQAPIVEPSAHVTDATPGVDVDVNDDSLVFPEPLRADVANVPVGDVLVSGSGGGGFMRRIKAISHANGKATLSTEPAALTDVFRRAHVHGDAAAATAGATTNSLPSISTNLTTPESFAIPLPVLGIGGIRLPIGGEGSDITVEEGSFALTPTVDYDFVVNDNRIESMKFVVSATAASKLRVKYNISRPPYVGTGATVHFGEPGKKVAEAPPRFILVWVGYVPVVIVVKVELLVGFLLEVGGDVSGETSFVSNGSVSAGVSYDGDWHNLTSSTLSMNVDGPPTFASLTLGGDVTLTAKLSVSLYDVAGPWVELQGYAGVGRESGTAAKLGDADIYGEVGIRGLVGVEANPFGKLAVGYQSLLFDKGLHVPIVASQ